MPGFDEAYPALREWVTSHGWIEVGLIEGFSSMIQVLNEGRLIWKGEASYPSLDAAFRAADEAIDRWLEEEFGG
jgi:hypothetical protein